MLLDVTGANKTNMVRQGDGGSSNTTSCRVPRIVKYMFVTKNVFVKRNTGIYKFY